MAEISVLSPSAGGPQVETVIARNGENLPAGRPVRNEIIVIVEGSISLEREDCAEAELHVATETIEIPAGVKRRIVAHQSPTHLVLIHPQPASGE
nr:hypothetical protein [Desulfuromonadales bacterium]